MKSFPLAMALMIAPAWGQTTAGCISATASILEQRTTYVLYVPKDCGKVDMIAPKEVEPTHEPKCRMPGRIWHEGKCWLPNRIPSRIPRS